MEFSELESQVQDLKIKYAEALRDCPIAVVENVALERDWLVGALKNIVVEGNFEGFSNATSLLNSPTKFGAVIIDGELNSQYGPDYVEEIRKKFPGAAIIGRTGSQQSKKDFQQKEADLVIFKGKVANPFDEIGNILQVILSKRSFDEK